MPGIKIVYADGTTEYVPDHRPLSEQKDQRKAELSDRRWQMCQYFVFDGVRTQADGAISPITGAVVARQMMLQQSGGVEPPPQIWKLNSSNYKNFTTTQLVMFGFAAQNHISQCFKREQELSELIDNATTGEELDEISFDNWPGE